MSASGVPRTVLHVDDDRQFTRLVGRMLERKGYEVVALNEAEHVLEEISRNDHRIVLLDIDMPGIDGLELLRRIKELDGGIQVIMLTGLVTLSNAMAAFRRGAEACFFKPIEDLNEFFGAIDGAFRKIEHWWNALNRLTRQRRQNETMIAQEATS